MIQEKKSISHLEKMVSIDIENQVKLSYIDYSMSVIVSRALPDVRDGLKPVHRRILYAMYILGILSKKSYKKSARIVGEVLGKYHPHGDSSVYDSIVRMAQNWSMRYKLIDGQGNFGSLDNDPPAAMRYTEIRLENISEEMLLDIEKNTVDMKSNFDDTLKEPLVLPTRMPNLLINGSSGIAVGMATNMPPHNLKEVIYAICAYIDNNNIDIKEISKYIIAPDFPTGGIIYGYQGIKDYFHTGKGKIILRAKIHFEEINNRQCIIVDEIPYQVNKEEMIKKTMSIIKEDKIKGIYNIKDESGRQGLRIVYFLKNDKYDNSNIILNKLYKLTQLQISFNINNIALVNGLPVQLNIKDLIKHFVDHRHDIIIRRTKFELKKAQDRLHILKGFLIILKNIDLSIDLIKKSNNVESAKLILIKNFNITPIQANSALDIKLQRLTNIEYKKILEEHDSLKNQIFNLKNLLMNKDIRMKIIKNELIDISNKYGDKRMTKVDYSTNNEINIEDFIPNEQMVLTISHAGYIKRTSLSEYRRQGRGGIGNKAVITREEDFLEHLFIGNNHQYLLFFTEKGKCFWIRIFEIPEGSKLSKGRAIQNLIKIDDNDKVSAYIIVKNIHDNDYINNHYVIMITKNGIIKKTLLSNYSRPRKNGIKALIIRDKDSLIEAKLTKGNSDIMVAVKSGKAIRFSEKNVRSMGRVSSGVNAITTNNKEDYVIGMICIDNNNKNNNTILVVSEKGFGKRSKLIDYRLTNRGGKGIKTINITKKTGNLISIKNVTDKDDLMIINKSGLLIRINISSIRIMGRTRQGVKLINIKENDQIASVAKVSLNKKI